MNDLVKMNDKQRNGEGLYTETGIIAGEVAFRTFATEASNLVDAGGVDAGRNETLVKIW